MRIGIDFHAVDEEGTGNCIYIRSLVEELLAQDQEDEFHLYVPDPGYPYLRRFDNLPHVRIHSLWVHNPILRMAVLGAKTLAHRLDVLHASYYASPLYSGALVLTIHDLSYIHCPGFFTRGARIKNHLLFPHFIKRAARVVTVSDHSREDVIRQFGPPRDKVVTVYNGCKPIYMEHDDPEANARLAEAGITPPYFLYVGRLNQRKNVGLLIQVFSNLKDRHPSGLRLVVAGREEGLGEHDRKVLDAVGHREEIIFTGYVDERDLPALYRNALALVYPSVFEGFGLPCLEAMACGCPVISTECTSIPEVVGDCGILVPEENGRVRGRHLLEAMERMLLDEEFRARCRACGLGRARRFTWKNAAREMIEIFREVGGGR